MSRVVFTLSDLDQSTAPRHMRQGSLTVSQNTRATKTGPRRKRRGFARQAITNFRFPVPADDTDSSPSASMQELSPGGQLFRDASDNIWARSSDGASAYFRGEHRRCGVSSRAAGFPEHKTIKPMSLAVGTQVWTFALSTGATSSAPTAEPPYTILWLTIEDAAGTVLRGPIQLPDATGNSIANYVAVYHPTTSKVFVFTVYRDDDIQVFSLSTAAGTLGNVIDAQASFYSNADAKWNCIDAIYDTDLHQVIVAYSSWNEAEDPGNTAKIRHGTLNLVGNVEANGTYAEDFNPGITGVFLCSGVSFLQGQPFTDDKARYVCWVKGDSTQDIVHLIQYTVDTVDMSVDDEILFSLGATRYELEHAGVCSGYYDPATDESVVFGEIMYPAIADEETSQPAGLGNSFNAQTIRCKLNNTTLALVTQSGAGAPAPGSWLASKPFQGADSKWYVLTGVDSGSDGYQRAFHVRRADVGFTRVVPDAARIVAQIGWPTASFRGHRWRGQLPSSPETITNSWGWAPTVAAISGGCKVALGQTGETPQTHSIEIVTVDFSAAFGRGVQIYDDHVLYPGGVPVVAGPRTPAHDLVPLIFPIQPPRLTAAGSGSALAAVLVTASFRYRDPSGRVTPSTSYPDPASLVFNESGTRTLAVRTDQHIGHGEVEILLWASVPGGTGLNLQAVIPNVGSSAEISINVDPQNFRSDTESLPAQAEGALLPNPPPPCRLAAMFADRVVLSGTPTEGEFLYSQPFERGRGPEFNIEGLAQVWTGRGAINGLCPVDLNSLALFRADQIAVVQGAGPPAAGGPYGTVLELNTEKGLVSSTTRGIVTIATPLGVMFQDAKSGRLAVVQPGLKVDDLPPGVEDTLQAGAPGKLNAGALIESEGALWFQLFGGGQVLLDLRHPEDTNASRWGNWHIWTSDALTESRSVGLVERDGGPLWLQANGSWRTYKTSGQLFQDTNAAGAQVDVLKGLTTGLMAPDGHHGEVFVQELQVIGTHLSASGVRFTTTDDGGTAEDHDVVLSTPFNYSWKPGNLLRVQEFRLTITELAGSTGEGFELDSIGVEFQAAGRMKQLPTTRVI